ncbi:MAG: hypothetical protein Q4C12_00125 [Clostridia bacterium]|nr:hypothetical protein [Clostridia bacterium]
MYDIVSIRMLVTSTNPSNIKFNNSWYVGDSNPLSDSMTTIENHNITTQAGEGELFRAWINPGYYVIILFQYRDRAGDRWGRYWYTLSRSSSNVYSSAPSFSYNQNTNQFIIGTSMTGRRIIEFYNTDRSYGYPTSIRDEETLNEMYYASVVDMEWDSNPYKGYYHLNGSSLTRWAPGRYTVGVQFNTSTNELVISSGIDNAIYELNNVLNDYGIYFTRSGTSGDISVIVDSEQSLYDIDPEADDVCGGTWETDVDSDGIIHGATIRLANDYYEHIPYMPYRSVALEELAQAMGAGYDQTEYPFNTIHTDFSYHNKPDYLTTKDKDILKLVYSDYVEAGDDYTDIALNLNIPKGCYMPSTSTTNSQRIVPASFLQRGCTYNVRVFIVNSSGRVSETSDWIRVTIPEKVRPSDFYWTYSKISGNSFNLTASEWNSFTSRINEFREYCGLSAYSFTTAYTGNDFTASIYRQARTAIQAIDGYGTYIPYVSSGDDITADMMNVLVSELNAIP